MSAPQFVLATSDDAHEIAALSRGLIEVGLRGWAWNPERVAKAIRTRDTDVLVARVDDHLVGFAIMEFGDTNAHISLLAVHPTYQRQGVGRGMIEWLEEAALAAGIETIELELRVNNYGARGFYHALGFRETLWIRGYYRGLESAVKMSRIIRRTIPTALQDIPPLL
jgi:ribosomal protein S18 acetylase RimI-like enzyme